MKTTKHNMFFAVKELAKITRGTHEALALKRLNNKQHPHLIRLLATFTHGGRFHLIFPWADGGNLKEFWETWPPQPSSEVHALESVTWMSEQILGLSRALELIHYCQIDDANTQGLSAEELKRLHGRHGDLKPENILWFKDERTSHETSIGVLKIGDFGFADFHTKHSRSNVRRSAVDGITPTYSAPEYDVTQRVSPQFDIWSFGCILLQFIVWYLCEWDGIEDFSIARAAEYEGFLFASDNFYSLRPTHKRSYKARIKKSVAEASSPPKQDLLCLTASTLDDQGSEKARGMQ
jgi:serine/threonine protein kinase